MILSIVSRLDLVRKREGLNKSQFEKKLSKSTGYLNMLVKRNSNPGADVIADFFKVFPHYSLEWLLIGEGEMLKESPERDQLHAGEPAIEYENMSLQYFHADIKKDLGSLAEGMTRNFEVVSDGIFETLKGQQKILKFIDDLDAKAISKATLKLNEMLKQTK